MAKRAAARKDTDTPATAPATTSLRGRIPTLAASQAQALRGFFASPRRWLLADGGQLHFSPGRAGSASETFEVDADGVRLALRLDASARRGGDGLRWNDYLGRSRLLAWSLAHEAALVRLSEGLGVSLVPVDASDAAPALDADLAWLAFSIFDDAVDDDDTDLSAVHGALGVPGDWLGRLIARAEPVYEDDPLPALGVWQTLPVAMRIMFDGPRLASADWASLASNDVIVLGRRAQLRASALSHRRTWPLAAAAAGWRIDGEARPTRTLLSPSIKEFRPMTDTDNAADATPDEAGTRQSAEDAAARELPVEISFDIGEVELSVGEVASLQPGYVFQLQTHLEGSNVTVRANGRIAGRGEVVAIGDTLGVRLLSWA